MVVLKSRKLKLFRKLKKAKKNKTKRLKNKRHRYTYKKSKHKSYRKTRRYYNVRQHIGGAGNFTNLTNIVLPGANDETNIGLGNEPIYFIGAVAVFFMLMICGCWLYDLRLLNPTARPNAQIELAVPPPPLPGAIVHTIALADPPPAGDTCPICLDALTNNIVKTPCQHFFHRGCITGWLAVDNISTCPGCRAQITTDLIPVRDLPQIEAEAVYIDVHNDVSSGGAASILDTIAKLAAKVTINKFKETFVPYFTFLELEPTDYNDIHELLKNINDDTNLEKLIKILARGLGFTHNVSDKLATYEPDSILVHVLDTDKEQTIRNVMQTHKMASNLNLNPTQIINLTHIRNILGRTLINYINDPDLNENKKDLLSSLRLASHALQA
jgi:hypothetical protein